MQRQVRRRIERSEKTKAKAIAQKPIEKKWIFLTIGVLVAIVVIVTSIAAFRNFDWTIARIDGTNIRVSDVGHALWLAEQDLTDEYFNMFPDEFFVDYDRIFRDNLTFGDVLRQEAAINVAVSKLLVAEAERLGVALTDEDRREIQRDIVEQWGTDLSPLHGMGIRTRQQLINAIEWDRYRGNVLHAKLGDIDDTEKLNLALELDLLWAAQHILVGFDGRESEEEAWELAQALHARALAGEDFEQLMLEYSDDQHPEMPPDLYTFTSGAMVPEFEQGTRELAIGEMSEPVRSMWGYHIILRAEPNPDPFTWMGDVDGALGEVLFEQFYVDARARITFTNSLGRVEVGQF